MGAVVAFSVMTSTDLSTERESVTVVTIDHRHGTIVSAHRTEAGAQRVVTLFSFEGSDRSCPRTANTR